MNNSNNPQITCVFCDYLSNKKYLLQNDLAFAVYDNFPVNKGHVLVMPKRHYPSYFEATQDEILAFDELIKSVKTLIDSQHRPDGYNIGINIGEAAGQTIFHLHIHIIPRYIGDVENPRGGIRKLKKPIVEYDG